MSTLSTLAIIAAPIVVPKIFTAVRSALYGSNRHGKVNYRPRPPRAPLTAVQLLILSLSLSLLLFSAFLPDISSDVFTHLAPPNSFLSITIPALRQPLDIRIPTTSLHTRWTTRVGRELDGSETELLNRLSKLDARLVYAASGPAALACSWCVTGNDWLYSIAPGRALTYLAVAIVLGASAPYGRRSLVATPLAVMAGAEFFARTKHNPIPNSLIALVVPLSQALLIAATLLLPPPEGPPPNPLPRIRALHLLRLVISREPAWGVANLNNAGHAAWESKMAREDPHIRELLEAETDGLSAWVDSALGPS